LSLLERGLMDAINTGRCIAVVGSGPSIEMGLPNWRQLAEGLLADMERQGSPSDLKAMMARIDSNELPAAFSIAGRVLGKDMYTALDTVCQCRAPSGRAYRILAGWPFAAYLTTNYDRCLEAHMRAQGLSPVSRGSSLEDLRALSGTVLDVVFHIHGTLDDPANVVLTSDQYREFSESPQREYWREKIFSALHMMPVVIIGYSVTDQDFQSQLQRAKELVEPGKKVYMFAGGMPREQVSLLLRESGVVVIPYDVRGDNHDDLVRVLNRYDPFIAKRGLASMTLPDVSADEVETATALYLFSRLRLSGDHQPLEMAYASAILNVLDAVPDRRISLSGLMEGLRTAVRASVSLDVPVANEALEFLRGNGLIDWPEPSSQICILPAGTDALKDVAAQRALRHEQFLASCTQFASANAQDLTQEDIGTVVQLMDRALVGCFRARGMEIARGVLAGTKIDLTGANDVLCFLNSASEELPTLAMRATFVDLATHVLLEPDPGVQAFLATLSQGYFAYHVLGLEPGAAHRRLDTARERIWVVDSSVLVRLLALGHKDNGFAVDLVSHMQDLGLRCVTTDALLREVIDHTWWADKHFSGEPALSANLLEELVLPPGGGRNVFVDGFAEWALRNGNPTFSSYLAECVGADYQKNLDTSLRAQLAARGIETLAFSGFEGFTEDLYAERDAMAVTIKEERQRRGTYRRDEQCSAEAEVVIIASVQNTAFLSRSHLLENLHAVDKDFNWTPESMLRFLGLFSNVAEDTLSQALAQESAYDAFGIVSAQTIGRYAEPLAQQARLEIAHEADNYAAVLGPERLKELRAGFEEAPSEEQPFYALQLAHLVAATSARRMAVAEKAANAARKTATLSDAERKEFDILKEKERQRTARHKKGVRRAQSQPGRRAKRKRK